MQEIKTDILIIDENCKTTSGSTNNNSYIRNNLADFINGHRTSVYNNVGEMPGIAVTNNVSQWKDDVPSAKTTDVTYDITNDKLNKAVYHYFPGASNEAGAVEYDANSVVSNRANYDFTPKDNFTDIIDNGHEILSSGLFSQGEVDSNITNSNFNPSVNTPDIGAYELGGTKWVAGIDFEPKTYPWQWPFEEEPSGIFTPEHTLEAYLFPTPARQGQSVTIQSLHEIKSIEIYSLNGQKIMSLTDTPIISTNSIKPGLYIVHIQSNNEQLTSKKLLVL